MASAESPPMLAVELAYSAKARQVRLLRLALAEGSTIADALAAGADEALRAWLEAGSPPYALVVWGRVRDRGFVLRDGDRIEVCRGLSVDPKEARRLRYHRDGGPKSLKERRQAQVAQRAARAAEGRAAGDAPALKDCSTG